MKELSIEEKARKYDFAIEALRGMMPNWERLSYNGKTFLQDLTHILPELKESEDEMIRKSLIDMLKNDEKCYLKEIAWLEKQGQVKESIISRRENKTCKENSNSLTGEDERIRREIIQLISCMHEIDPRRERWLTWLEKPAEWSEEDEKNFNEALSYIKDDALKELIKSLKQRIGG